MWNAQVEGSKSLHWIMINFIVIIVIITIIMIMIIIIIILLCSNPFCK